MILCVCVSVCLRVCLFAATEGSGTQAELDEVDSYVQDLQEKTQRTRLKKVNKEIAQLEMDLKQTEQLLQFLKPSVA